MRSYSINLERFSLSRYKSVLLKQELLPSHKILLENIKENFNILEASGIENLQDLTKILSSKKKLEEFMSDISTRFLRKRDH